MCRRIIVSERWPGSCPTCSARCCLADSPARESEPTSSTLRSPCTPPPGRWVRPANTLILVMLPRKCEIAAHDVTPPTSSTAARLPAIQASKRLRLRGGLGVAGVPGWPGWLARGAFALPAPGDCGLRPRGLSSGGSCGQPPPSGPSFGPAMDRRNSRGIRTGVSPPPVACDARRYGRPVPGPTRDDWPGVSVVLPVLNEERHVDDAVASVLAQDYPGPLEIVLALGPSHDRTDEVAAGLSAADPRVRTVRNPTRRTPEELNLAIGVSRPPVVARVDGHAQLPGDYLRTAVQLLDRTEADNVGGLMWAEGVTDVEKAIARAMTSKLGVGNARFHVGGEEGPAETVYLGVFRRTALDRVGGYDEVFARAQDWEMNYRIRSTGGLVWFSPALRVTYRPRPSLGALARQYFHYGRWRREVMRRHPGSVNVRYLAPPIALVAFAGGLVAGAAGLRWAFVLPAGYLVLVTAGGLAISGGLPWRSRLTLPVVLTTMHGAWGAGFLTGLVKR